MNRSETDAPSSRGPPRATKGARECPSSRAAAEQAAAEEGSLQSAVAVHSAAPEAGRLPCRIHACQRRAVGTQDPGFEVGLQAAERLAGQHVQPYGDQRTTTAGPTGPGIAWVKQFVRRYHADEPVAHEPSGGGGGDHLRILPKPLRTWRSRAAITRCRWSAS